MNRYDTGMSFDGKSSASHDAVLTTARTVLRATRERDVFELYKNIFSVPAVMRWVFGGTVLSATESERFIRAHFNFRAAPIGLCTLEEKASGQVIGFAGLTPCDILSDDDVEFGFVLASEAWGRGFATEIGRAQLALGFEQLGRSRLLALASTENVGSIATLEKLGMSHQLNVTPPGRTERRVYSMLATDWHD